MNLTRRLVLASPLAALLPPVALAADPAPVTVLEAWARATPPGARTAAAYLTITNPGREADRLIGVSSEASERVELHTHEMAGGVARMRMVDSLDIPAGGQLVLQPDGAHLMLVGLRQALEPGGQLVLTLRFAKAGEIPVTAPVLALGSAGPAAPHPPHHHPG